MEQTTITLSMCKEDVQHAVAAVLERLAIYPPQLENYAQSDIIAYNMGMSLLFECLRSTF